MYGGSTDASARVCLWLSPRALALASRCACPTAAPQIKKSIVTKQEANVKTFDAAKKDMLNLMCADLQRSNSGGPHAAVLAPLLSGCSAPVPDSVLLTSRVVTAPLSRRTDNVYTAFVKDHNASIKAASSAAQGAVPAKPQKPAASGGCCLVM